MTDARGKGSAIAALLGLALLGSACSGSREYRDVEGISFLTYESVGGVTYGVGRDKRQDNRFYVSSKDQRKGVAEDMRTAVRRVYRCQTTNLTHLADDQSAAEMTATFCRGR